MTQEFHISVTPIGEDDYLVRTERVAPGVPLAEEQVTWPVEEWLTQASLLMNDPLQGLLRGDILHSFAEESTPPAEASEAQGTLVALGQQLYNALFQGTIRDSWMTAQGIAQHRHEVLRLRLGLKDTRLPRLPWEVLHAGNRPIATGTDVVFSRYHSNFATMASLLQFQPTSPIEANQPLKILMVLAAPTDQEMLALKQEALHLQEELQTSVHHGSRNGGRGRYSDVHLTILEQPGREQLTQALEHNHYHVLHYAGHSNLGTAGGKLYLVSSKTGLTETLSGDDLAGLLVNNGIRMAVFNSCRGVYTATTEGASETGDGNLAEALVKRGIPAVLAMAERIPDDVALNLSRLFYRNLKQVYPVDLSLNRARQGLISSYSSKQLYWALPILYLHPEFDGNLQSLDSTSEPTEELLTDRLPEADDSVEAVKQKPALAAIKTEPQVSMLRDGKDTVLQPVARESAASHESISQPAAGGVTAFEDESHDLDALEFDDPAYQSDMETVAHLVNQLSNGAPDDDHLLPAHPSENLLPEAGYTLKADDYLILPDYPSETTAEATETAASIVEQRGGALTSAGETSSEVEVYSELTRMLAETGKLTEAIATCHQAVQDNPNDANAYYQLGMALNQQGYVAEAIAAYHQALRLNPTLADVHNQLGLALYQQGKVNDAVRSYDHAIQLDPGLASARHNLEVTLLRQGNLGEAKQALLEHSPTLRRGDEQRVLAYTDNNLQLAGIGAPSPSIPYKKASWYRQPLLWVGAGMLATLVVGSWVFRDRWLPTAPQLPPTETAFTNPNSTGDLKQLSTNLVTALATEKLNQGKMAEAQAAVEALLDRGALAQAAVVLTPALGRQSDNATVNFLMGRLAWQSIKVGNKDYSVDDARRYWETAVKQQPSAQAQNALGFAYYTEGKFDRASRAWLQALKPDGKGENSPGAAQTSPSQTLTAYAGLALIAAKTAANQPPTKQASLQSEAIKLRQRVLTDDPVNFQPEELAKNWMWSEPAIRDWRSTLAIK
ncbi:MAG: CHAT domain-containing protein [Leptolyngbya sp. BL-A-14]